MSDVDLSSHGGRTRSGTDLDGDGVRDEDEIGDVSWVCHGENAAPALVLLAKEALAGLVIRVRRRR